MAAFNLSELRTFLNDDSDGHRLADFLRKRRGDVVPRSRFVLANYEPDDLSLSVRVEKLKTPPLNNDKQKNNATIPQLNHDEPDSSHFLNVGSPRTRKNGNYTHLKRHSLIRLPGRRRLFQKDAHNSSLSDIDFSPKVCSSPLRSLPSQCKTKQTDIAAGTTNPNELPGIPTERCNSTMCSAQGTNNDLRAMLEEVIDTTLRKYKEKENHARNVSPVTPKRQSATPAVKNVVEQCSSPIKRVQTTISQLPATSQMQANAEVLPPETQTLFKNLKNGEHPMVIIPVYQTFNGGTPVASANNATTATNAAPIYNETYSLGKNIVKLEGDENLNENQTLSQQSLKENELRFTDIITDDEDEVPTRVDVGQTRSDCSVLNIVTDDKDKVSTRKQQTSYFSPLNLAHAGIIQSNKNDCNKFERKVRQRKVQKPAELSNVNRNTTRNYPLNLRRSNGYQLTPRRCRAQPLNKAPNTPINGERYAHELKMQLAGLSNREILDLRQRNSLGKLYPERDRKTCDEKSREEQMRLEEEIQMEILRRNLLGNSEGLDDCTTHAVEEVVNEVQQQQTSDEGIFTELLPAPEEFNDIDAYSSSLIDERSCDRVSFMPPPTRRSRTSCNRSQRTKNSMPQIVQSYLDVTKELQKTKKTTSSKKRTLYTKGQSDTENSPTRKTQKNDQQKPQANDEFSPIQIVPSPPNTNRTEMSEMADFRVVSPPPPLSPETTTQLTEPTHAASSCDVDTVANEEAVFKKPKNLAPRSTRAPPIRTTTLKRTIARAADDAEEADFLLRRSKRERKPAKNIWSYQRTDSATLFEIMYRRVMMKSLKNKMLSKSRHSQIMSTSRSTISETGESSASSSQSVYSLLGDTNASSASSVATSTPLPSNAYYQLASIPEEVSGSATEVDATKEAKTAKKQIKKSSIRKQVVEATASPQPTPPPTQTIEQLNRLFDQLKNNSEVNAATDDTVDNDWSVRKEVASKKNVMQNVKKFHVRLKRCQLTENQLHSSAAEVSGAVAEAAPAPKEATEKVEFSDWLKRNVSENVVIGNAQSFESMQCSMGENLMFTQLEGIEYAFYDTEDACSLGYLRFEPQQSKAPKRARKFQLHFVVLAGQFKISSNADVGTFNLGDMIAINKGSRYAIQNLSDYVGLLQVIKK